MSKPRIPKGQRVYDPEDRKDVAEVKRMRPKWAAGREKYEHAIAELERTGYPPTWAANKSPEGYLLAPLEVYRAYVDYYSRRLHETRDFDLRTLREKQGLPPRAEPGERAMEAAMEYEAEWLASLPPEERAAIEAEKAERKLAADEWLTGFLADRSEPLPPPGEPPHAGPYGPSDGEWFAWQTDNDEYWSLRADDYRAERWQQSRDPKMRKDGRQLAKDTEGRWGDYLAPGTLAAQIDSERTPASAEPGPYSKAAKAARRKQWARLKAFASRDRSVPWEDDEQPPGKARRTAVQPAQATQRSPAADLLVDILDDDEWG